jgi:serine/threonine protein kinase
MPIVGVGTHSVVVQSLPFPELGAPLYEFEFKKLSSASASSSRDKNVVYRVYTMSADVVTMHEKEIEKYKRIHEIDRKQHYFGYPIRFVRYVGNPEILEYLYRKNKIKEKVFDIRAPYMCVDVIPFSGMSVEAFRKRKQKLSREEARGVINNLVKGVSLLHSHLLVHKDIHKFNVLIDAKRHARIIDFELMQDVRHLEKYEQTRAFSKDIKGLSTVIRDVCNLVREKDAGLDRLHYRLGREATPMTISGLESIVNDCFTKTVEKRALSPPSSASPRMPFRRALEF